MNADVRRVIDVIDAPIDHVTWHEAVQRLSLWGGGMRAEWFVSVMSIPL